MNQPLQERIIEQCIYCGDNNSLTDEHILPFALNGVHILRKGSCKKCAGITSLFEMRVLRGPLLKYRYLKQFRSRRHFKNFKTSEEYITRNKQGEIRSHVMDLNSVGIYTFMPQFAEPKYIVPNSMIDGIECKGVHFFKAPPKKINLDPKVAEVKIKIDFPTGDFLRFLSKIALGYTFLKYGKNKFRSYITNLILGKTSIEDWKYLGSPRSPSFTAQEIGIKLYETNGMLWCEIKIFNDIPVVYKVIVGEKL